MRAADSAARRSGGGRRGGGEGEAGGEMARRPSAVPAAVWVKE